jgi:hypothetical protein
MLFNFLIQCKVMTLKHIDGRTYKLAAPASPAPRAGSVYIAEGDSTPLHLLCLLRLTTHMNFIHFNFFGARPRHARPFNPRARPPCRRDRSRVPGRCARSGTGVCDYGSVCLGLRWHFTFLFSRASHLSDCCISARSLRQQRKVP